MTDDRALDIALIKLLGVKKVHYPDWDEERTHPYYIPSGKPWRTHQIDAHPVPHFTTHWIAMSELLSALATYHKIYLIKLSNGSLPDKTPYACWLGRSADDAPWCAVADDAPRAVAKAAFWALSGEAWKE